MGNGLRMEERTGFGLATVMARNGVRAEEIAAVLGIMPPDGPRWVRGNGITLIGTGPSTWLALAERAAFAWAETLREVLGELASIADQSGGYVILRLTGNGARTLLQRGAAIDFHPSVFAPGSVAVTAIAHIGVIIWQVDEMPTYDVAVFRSFAGSFRHWIDHTAATL